MGSQEHLKLLRTEYVSQVLVLKQEDVIEENINKDKCGGQGKRSWAKRTPVLQGVHQANRRPCRKISSKSELWIPIIPKMGEDQIENRG